MICGGLVTGLGDAIAQVQLENTSKFDTKRSLNLTLYGILVGGFLGHYWFRWLDIAFGRKASMTSAARKTFVDQLISTPVEILTFFTWASYGKDESCIDLHDKLSEDYFKVLSVNYLVWVPMQTLNFLIVPERHRVLFNNAASVLWTSFLSFSVHNSLSEYWPK